MPAVVVTPRQRWIDAGLDALADGGTDAVRVETIATVLGVTKGGFYGHFRGRPALLEAILDEWERRCVDEVIEEADALGGDAADRLRLAGRLSSSERLQRIDLAVREWARHDRAVADRLRRVDGQRMDYLRSLFGMFIDEPGEVEVRSTLLFALAIGRHFMMVGDDRATARAVISRAAEFLLRSEASSPRSGEASTVT
ncbi:TetR/AcrR family transcriptional regulator [Agromyces sp. NPDC058484]|uniref:TetR/AcrR family transcriptional regulator n=1 Tax=Agromyces sp. NPDC058484 TaxID=3346524 RepID=UPI00365A7A74